MIILITGATHTGKTLLALTAYLWPIVAEMIKTAIENKQNLIVEGCYIPFDWEKDFGAEYINHIKYCCLVMSRQYIQNHFDEIRKYANVIEDRMDDAGCTMEMLYRENAVLEQCQKHGVQYLLIDGEYNIDAMT